MSDKQGKKRGSAPGARDIPKGGGDLAASSAPHTGIRPSVKSSDVLVDAVLPDPQHERFAQAVADGASYAEAYKVAGYAFNTGNACRLARYPLVSARIRMLRTAAAERRVCSIASRMQLLDEMIHADPDELTRVVTQPCATCWTDHAIADAMSRYMAASGSPNRGEPPNTDAPRHDCPTCSGDGLTRVVLTPTAELSAGARALFKSARQNAKGEIIVETHDRLAAIAELNKMQEGSLAASRSLSANIHAFIPPARDADPAAALRLFEAFDVPGG